MPGPVNLPSFAGCHALLAQGARLVQTADDIVAALSRELAGFVAKPRAAPPVAVRPAARPASGSPPSAPPPRPPKEPSPPQASAPPPDASDLGGLEADVFALLGESGRLHIDALTTRLSAASGAVSRALVLLELKGLVRKLPGMYYTRDA